MKSAGGRKVWIEVALNGAWTRGRQPCIPTTPKEIVDEGLACASEGASILHFHAYDTGTGRQTADIDTNIRIIEAIKSRADVIIYPSISSVPIHDLLAGPGGRVRYETCLALAKRGLLEWMVVDPGSTNLVQLAPAPDAKAHLYLNTTESLDYAMAMARQYGIRPSYAIYEPGFARLGSQMAGIHGTLTPVYRLMFSEQFAFGFPPEEFALTAYVQLLERTAPGAPWMIAGLGVDISRLIPLAVRLGGHVRVGLEDAVLGARQPNWMAVRDAARSIAAAGAGIANPSEVRLSLP